MYNANLEKRTVKIVSRMFYRNTFDITLLDRYFLEKDVDIDLIFSIHSYIYKNIGRDTFMFTDIFSIKFELIAKKFISIHPRLFKGHNKKFTVDDMNLVNQIVFRDDFVQNIFSKWLSKKS